MNELQKKLVAAGLAKPPKSRKSGGRAVKCRKCGEDMVCEDNTNLIICHNCGNYIIASEK